MFCDFITDAELSKFERIHFSVKILFLKKFSKFDHISDGSSWNILFVDANLKKYAYLSTVVCVEVCGRKIVEIAK